MSVVLLWRYGSCIVCSICLIFKSNTDHPAPGHSRSGDGCPPEPSGRRKKQLAVAAGKGKLDKTACRVAQKDHGCLRPAPGLIRLTSVLNCLVLFEFEFFPVSLTKWAKLKPSPKIALPGKGYNVPGKRSHTTLGQGVTFFP